MSGRRKNIGRDWRFSKEKRKLAADLSGPLDALPDAEVAEDPNDEEGDDELHLEAAHVVHPVCDLEDAIPRGRGIGGQTSA